MKSGTLLMVAALLNFGVANAGAVHADTLEPGPGFDRVGRVGTSVPQPAGKPGIKPVRLAAAADGGGVADYPARKREMARRLLWLMLSAR